MADQSRNINLLPQRNGTIDKITERHMLDHLGVRYSKTSQGGSIRYAFGEHVRNAAGFDAQRTADFMAMDLWPNFGRGLELHGHEVKVSRSDWLVELKNPWKSEAFRPYMNRWWLVVSDPKIVNDGELPEGWGLMIRTTNGLRVKVSAPYNDAEPIPKTMMAAFLRAVALTATRRATLASLQASRETYPQRKHEQLCELAGVSVEDAERLGFAGPQSNSLISGEKS